MSVSYTPEIPPRAYLDTNYKASNQCSDDTTNPQRDQPEFPRHPASVEVGVHGISYRTPGPSCSSSAGNLDPPLKLSI